MLIELVDSSSKTSHEMRRSRQPTQSREEEGTTIMSGTEYNNKAVVINSPSPLPHVEGTANYSEEPDYDYEEDEDEEDGNGGGADAEHDTQDDGEDDHDPFAGFGIPGGSHSGLSSTLRALTGMMSGLSVRLRELLNHIRQDDLSIQVIALQELSEILLVSNEDNLSGHFSPDAFVKELVILMTNDDSPEVMLLACRCLANLMEALPASVANVVYGNAVPVLCQKLLEISFIDLAEQALSTLEKISVEYPSSIVREGGLTACLSYLDFFATSTQRTAVTIAANCCRNIADDSFLVVRDVMPTLLNVLSSNDQRVVEQASLCVSGIVESFKYEPAKLEELVSVDLLRAVLRLLLPGTTNHIGPNIHTQFLRVLAFAARASPRLSAELFKLNVVETLYQILTGVSPPIETENVGSKLDSVVIMQALIHRPREQIVETLNVICELLPGLPGTDDFSTKLLLGLHGATDSIDLSPATGRDQRVPNMDRLNLLQDCNIEVRRFVLIIFPTLTDAYSSTVNLSVRQKVLTAQLKMLSNIDESILAEALIPVPYASFLASILSQQDHPSLVMLGLQATELLLRRLEKIYRYQLYREGVIYEIQNLASDNQHIDDQQDCLDATDASQAHNYTGTRDVNESPSHESECDGDGDEDDEVGRDDKEPQSSNDEDGDSDNEDNEPDVYAGEMSPMSSRASTLSPDMLASRFNSSVPSMKSRIRNVAKRFLELHEKGDHGQVMKAKATSILVALSTLAEELEAFFLKRTSVHLVPENGKNLFLKLASYFDNDILESVTSAELLASGMVRALLEVFSNQDEKLAQAAQATFLEVFMGHAAKPKSKTATAESATPFSVMIHKLQDLLSRSEHFEVITVHHSTYDGNRSSPASMLGKQIRLRLVADNESNIPRPYRNIMVSIHAIATFKSLDDYLRPRFSLAERPRGMRRDGLSRALAAMAGSGGLTSSSSVSTRLAERSLYSSTPALPPPPPPPPLTQCNSTISPSSSRQMWRQADRTTPGLGRSVALDRSVSPYREKTGVRRSTRRHPNAGDTSAPPPPSLGDETKQSMNVLECADENQLVEEGEVDNSALDAIVGELDEDMDDRGITDPSAVNLEFATGGNITAREDDGTRDSTLMGSSVNRNDFQLSGHTTLPGSHSSSKPMSYASALQTVPQDWHIEFSLDEAVIPNETTIYRAVHTSATGCASHSNRSVWSSTHTIKFRRVSGPPPTESLSLVLNAEAEEELENGIPSSLTGHPATSSILRLLNILHELNTNIEDVLVENNHHVVNLHMEPLSQFVNTKLTAKLNRQLEEPLIVASSCLPSWSEDLARLYPFLFPFETRHLFLQSTSFGYARSMARWQVAQSVEENRRDRNNERPFLGRLQRQKVRISRLKILESALKVMELYGASQSILEVEYFEEVGTGLGPTLEFYSTVSKEFSKKKLKLWREVDTASLDDYASGQTGLFPRPVSPKELSTPNGERTLHLFRMLGKFVARSMIDSRIIDIHFNPFFFRIGDATLTGVKPSLGAVKVVDPGLARSLKTIKKFALAKKEIDEDPNRTPAQKVTDTENIVIDNVQLEELCLDFTLPGYPDIELEANGSHKRVTMDNVDVYIERVIDLTLGSGVLHQVMAFSAGFSQVFPFAALRAFTPDELVSLFGRVEEDWTLESMNNSHRCGNDVYANYCLALTDSIKADHGYNMDSRSVKNLLQTMSKLDLAQRREFLQFTTGSPKLPIGGMLLAMPNAELY